MKHDKYREALQKRSIKPSSDSWEKLNSSLTALEKKEKGRNWLFLKVASVILIFISVGFYFLQGNDDMMNSPEIVSPTFKEKPNAAPGVNDVEQSEIAVTPGGSAIKNQTIIDSNMTESSKVEIAFTEQKRVSNISSKNLNELKAPDSLSEAILITETLHSEKQFIDDEVEQLLYESKIKLIVNGEISTKKVVDANALLNSVEDDLYKDLKQKLIEKIANKLKNPKEVVTSREN